MITNILFVLLIVSVAAILARAVDTIRKREKRASSRRMSFKETLDLTELPIITFKNKDKKVNFLLDTGASHSVINKSSLDGLEYTIIDKEDTIYGADGNKTLEGFVNMEVVYRDKSYTEEFQTADLEKAFNNLKNDFGVNLHGILGNSFFQKYKYVIDFDELAAYSVI